MYENNKTYEVSTVLVPYEIPENFEGGIAFIAEAPGQKESELGRPLVGDSGKLFDKWLKEIKIKRKECIIGNVFRFRPSNNKVDKFFVSDKIAREQKVDIAKPPHGKCRGKNLIAEFESEFRLI